MSDALFDVSPYGGPPKPPREPRRVTAPPEPVAVSGPEWNGVSSKTPNLCHFVVGQKVIRHLGRDVAAVVSACGIVVVPHTIDPEAVRLGCSECYRLKP